MIDWREWLQRGKELACQTPRSTWEFLVTNRAALGYMALFAVLWLKPRLGGLRYGELDPSFTYGVEKAASSGLSFGSHFIATYGPLSYAVVNYVPENLYKVVVCDLLAVAALGFGVAWFARLYLAGSKRLERILVCVLLVFGFSLAASEWLFMDIFILYLFIFLKTTARNQRRLLIILAVVSAVLSLVKFTIGAGSIGALIFLVLFSGAFTKPALIQKAKDLALAGGTYLGSLIVIAFVLGTTNIFAYAIASARMSSGFSQAMSLITPANATATKYVAFTLFALAIWIIVKFKRQALSYAFLIPVFYIFWKYLVVRQDGHILVITQLVPILALLIYVSAKRIRYYDGLFLAVIAASGAMAVLANGVMFVDFQNSLNTPIDNLRHHRVTAFFNTPRQKSIWAQEASVHLPAAELPATMRAAIGNKGVDVFPWEAVIIRANNLRWDNRPSPFSFETYDTHFDKANADFISKNGPAFIVWHGFSDDGVSSVDQRTDLWDEPQTLAAILAHYEFVESNEKFILLKRVDHPKVAVKEAPKNPTFQQVGFKNAVVPTSDKLLCMNMSITNNPKETIKDFVVRERPFYVNLTYTDGTIRKLRFVREQAGSGLLINQLPKSWDSLISLLKDHHTTDVVTNVSVVDEPTTKIAYYPCLTK